MGTPPPTQAPGPSLKFVGVVRADGCRFGCFNGFTCVCANGTPTPNIESGVEVFTLINDNRGLVVVEAGRGPNNLQPQTIVNPSNACVDRPSVQIQADRDLGDGASITCDPDPPFDYCTGGVPGGLPLFEPGDAITRALNKFSCRFTPKTVCNSGFCDSCTLNSSGNPGWLGAGTRVQFCGFMPSEAAFPPGDTLLTVQVMDTSGTAGERKSIKVRAP